MSIYKVFAISLTNLLRVMAGSVFVSLQKARVYITNELKVNLSDTFQWGLSIYISWESIQRLAGSLEGFVLQWEGVVKMTNNEVSISKNDQQWSFNFHVPKCQTFGRTIKWQRFTLLEDWRRFKPSVYIQSISNTPLQLYHVSMDENKFG